MWRTYNDGAIAEARERGTALLMLIMAPHCPFSAALKARLESASNVIEDRFVCVLIDAGADPDLDREMRGAAWPTLRVLGPDGENAREVTPGDLDATEGLSFLDDPGPGPVARPDFTAKLGPIVEEVTDQLLSSVDPDWGGWGTRQKFPHPDALHLLLVRWSETGRQDLLGAVLRTLRCMQGREIYDAVEGGFYRFARARDWSEPHFEKPLLSNAKRMLAYAEAHQALGEESFRRTALGIAGWMDDALFDDSTGAFRGSQDADPEYARLASKELRGTHGAPPTDPTIHADRNAWAAIALLKAGSVFGDERLTRRALDTLDFLVEELFDEGRGVSHYWNGTWNQPGDLRDQGILLRALLDAVHYAGANRMLAAAESIADWTTSNLDAEDGSFRRNPFAADGGAARGDHDDLRWNSIMGEALIRLGHMTGSLKHRERGERALLAWTDAWRPHGYATASYARALDLLVRPPLRVIVHGSTNDPVTRDLARASLSPYVASRVMVTLDPMDDEGLLARLGLASGAAEGPHALLQHGTRTFGITSDPLRLPALMTRSERS